MKNPKLMGKVNGLHAFLLIRSLLAILRIMERASMDGN
jgi:hypothetical protein